jgi:serine/threonine-protein kinase RsbW
MVSTDFHSLIMPTLHLSAELKNLAVLRRFIEESSLAMDASSHAALDLIQAVDEAATNIIMHGYAGQPGEIEINIHRHDDVLVACLRDRAPAFDPTLVPPPDLTLSLEERPIGGLGIFLMRQSVDEIHYRPLPAGGNELTLVKRAF